MCCASVPGKTPPYSTRPARAITPTRLDQQQSVLTDPSWLKLPVCNISDATHPLQVWWLATGPSTQSDVHPSLWPLNIAHGWVRSGAVRQHPIKAEPLFYLGI
jgi:hypothetical protein